MDEEDYYEQVSEDRAERAIEQAEDAYVDMMNNG